MGMKFIVMKVLSAVCPPTGQLEGHVVMYVYRNKLNIRTERVTRYTLIVLHICPSRQ